MTLAEQTLWEHLRHNRLSGVHFRRQQVISGFIVDFYCHEAGLVVELDDGIYARQVQYDKERDCILKQNGLRVMRIPNQDIENDINSVLKRIVSAIANQLGLV